MKKDTALIFDMDGTLWNATFSILEVSNKIIQEELEIKDYLDINKITSVMGLEIEEIAQSYFPNLDNKKRLDILYKIMESENKYLSEHGGKLYDGVEATLKKLSKEYDLMIVTNAQDGYVDAMFSYHPLSKYFIDYETYGRTMRPKGENIKLVMKRNNYKKAYYIGDTQKDSMASKYAGIPFIWASYGFGVVDDYNKKIDNFEELIDLFIK